MKTLDKWNHFYWQKCREKGLATGIQCNGCKKPFAHPISKICDKCVYGSVHKAFGNMQGSEVFAVRTKTEHLFQEIHKMQTETKNVNKGKWGYYSCNYETYLKLKELYGYYLLALRRIAEWNRWSRKQPQNRVIRRWKRDAQGRKCGYEVVGPRPEPKLVPIFSQMERLRSYSGVDLGVDTIKTINSHIEDNYRQARHPCLSENDVLPLTISNEQIDSMLSVLRKWREDDKATTLK